MKKILAIILVLSLTLSIAVLAGCGKKDDTTETEATEVVTVADVTETVTTADVSSDVETSDSKVTDQAQTEKDTDKDPVLTDSVVNDRFAYKKGTKEYAVPQIMLTGANFQKINDEIYNDYLNETKDAVEDLENGDDPSLIRVGYDWTVYKDTISLCVYRQYDDAGSQFFSVYNIDKTTGESRSDSFVYGLFGYSEEEFYSAVKKGLENAHYKTNSETPMEEYKDYWYDALTKTLADDNVKAAIPHINSENELCVVISAYSVGGPPKCYYDIKLSDFIY